jgi:hypothetical protein
MLKETIAREPCCTFSASPVCDHQVYVQCAGGFRLELELSIDNHHLEALAASPRPAILELIFNALDADATRIEVQLARQELEGIVDIRVIDNGHGMTHEEARAAFELLGGSWKQEGATSKGLGRGLHGNSGQGRFRAAGIGQMITWRSVADTSDGRELTVVEIPADNRRRANVADPVPTDQPIGTQVVISGISEPPEGLGEGAEEYFVSQLAPSIRKFKSEVIFAGKKLDPSAIQASHAEYPIFRIAHEPLTPRDDPRAAKRCRTTRSRCAGAVRSS